MVNIPEPGPYNLVTDVDGLSVGNAQDSRVATGVTIILPGGHTVAAVDTRGGGPGTRETDALDPACLVDAVNAIVLSGGSSYGLEAASVVAARLGALGRGFAMRPEAPVSPVVPAAILYDLANGGDKQWGEKPPYNRLGGEALDAALTAEQTGGKTFALGNAGAGYGATAGDCKGGLGSASFVCSDGLQTGALAAVNAFGTPVIPGTTTLWAAPWERQNEMGGQRLPPRIPDTGPFEGAKTSPQGRQETAGGNTTLAVVATNAALSPVEAKRVAIMAHDGLARAIRPLHTAFDGDTVFALATGQWRNDSGALLTSRIGALAADCLTRAVGRAIYEARPLNDTPSFRSRKVAGGGE